MSNNVSETVALLWAQASGQQPEPVWMSAASAIMILAFVMLCGFIAFVFGSI